MFWTELIVALLLLVTVALNALAVWRARSFVMAQQSWIPPSTPRPPVSLLVPVCGVEGDGVEHFARFCRLDWPSYEVIFTVLDTHDPATLLLQEMRSTPSCEVKVQVGGPALGANLKVRNLLNASHRASHEWLVICDADVRPDPDFLEGLVTPLTRDAETGMVHSLYRSMEEPTLASSWENVWINCDFWAQGLLGDWVRGTDFAFGAAMALNRKTLDQIGGLEALRDYLADDYQMGHRVAALGKRLVFNPRFITLQTQAQTWRSTWNHLLRWSRTIRVCQPGGFAGSILTNMTLMALVAMIVNFRAFGVVSLLVLALRVEWANQCRNWITGRGEWWGRWWLVLFKDLAQALLWVLAFRNGRIEWRGSLYHLKRDGKLTPSQPVTL